MSGIYAADTTVSVDRSKQEIERILQRYGASEFASGWRIDKAMMQFRMKDRIVRFVLALPQKDEFKTTSGKFPRRRTENQMLGAMEQAQRQRWRALALAIKAKLEPAQPKKRHQSRRRHRRIRHGFHGANRDAERPNNG